MKNLWKNYKKISNKILDKEAFIVLTIIYWVLFAPGAIFFKIFADPLNLKSDKKPLWYKKNCKNSDNFEALKKQY